MSSRGVHWSEVTAVFGGTFDPPHLGHRKAVEGLLRNPGVHRVLVVPSGTPPFKPQATSNEHRLEMTRLGFAGLSDVQVDGRELDRAIQTGKPSYTIDTLQDLKREHAHLAFVAGADQLTQLHAWHRFRDLLGCAHWIILTRKPDGEATAMKVLNEWESSGLIRKTSDQEWATSATARLALVPTEAPALSSSEIRETIGRISEPKALLTRLQSCLLSPVLTYLMEHRIYGMRPHEHER